MLFAFLKRLENRPIMTSSSHQRRKSRHTCLHAADRPRWFGGGALVAASCSGFALVCALPARKAKRTLNLQHVAQEQVRKFLIADVFPFSWEGIPPCNVMPSPNSCSPQPTSGLPAPTSKFSSVPEASLTTQEWFFATRSTAIAHAQGPGKTSR